MPVFETGTFNHSVTCPHRAAYGRARALVCASAAAGIASFSRGVEQKNEGYFGLWCCLWQRVGKPAILRYTIRFRMEPRAQRTPRASAASAWLMRVCRLSALGMTLSAARCCVLTLGGMSGVTACGGLTGSARCVCRCARMRSAVRIRA
jgi:hypothetical protein